MTWLTAGNFIYYNYKILNIKKFYNKSLPILVLHSTSNKEEIIQTHRNAIPMSGYNLTHLNDIQLEKNQLLIELANKIRVNDLSSVLPSNILYNQKKRDDFFKYNQQQYTISKYNCDKILHFEGEDCKPPSSLIKKQHLCILKKKYRLKSSRSSLFDLKSKEFERFFIFNLLQNFQNIVLEKSFDMEKSFNFSDSTQFNKFEKNIKKIESRFSDVNNIKTKSNYQKIRTIPVLVFDFANQILIIKKNKIRIRIPKTKGHNTKVLCNYFDSMIEPIGKKKNV